MRRTALFLALLLVPNINAMASPSQRSTGKNAVSIRGQVQDIYYYPAKASGGYHIPVLFVPGDGGWRGFAVEIAQTMSQWGYDVYGLDTKRYLESFTGKTALKESDVMSDFGRIAAWIHDRHTGRIVLAGWSEGAGLCLLGASPSENKELFSGVITLGLPEQNTLGWRLADYLTWITKRSPNEPVFRSMDYMSTIAPLRLWMLQSTRDEYVPIEVSRSLFTAAQEPKKFFVIEATNHRFDGNRSELFQLLKEGLQWLTGI
jgi:fermentation-respiration switch protein FrsA (DUF1100 family)